jgi:hypothetical protein
MSLITENDTKQLWNDVLSTIKAPSLNQCKWAEIEGQLAVIIVEPRSHEWLRAVLYNMAHVYGGTNVSLHIFHGTTNDNFVKDICNNWHGVKYHNLAVNNMTPEEYSVLLTTPNFWEFIKAKYALIFQTDTIIRRRIDEEFFQYDYVGAPWPFYVSHLLTSTKNVGNGGFSLRNVNTMRLITSLDGPAYPPLAEDVFFAERTALNKLPDVTSALSFSVEHMWHPDPCGLHQSWRFHSYERIKELLLNIPGI